MESQLVKREDRWDLYEATGQKIASSLDGCAYKLSLKNCQEIELGYNLYELAYSSFPNGTYETSEIDLGLDMYKLGFQKALEILGDKKFSEEDMSKAWSEGYHRKVDELNGNGLRYFDKFIQSLQQTEWEVEIVEFTADDLKSINNEWHILGELKLDADECLILKRIKTNESK